MSAELYLQGAIYARLHADLTVPVYSNVPDNEEGPYVVIGDMAVAEWGTDARTGSQITASVDVWQQGTSMVSVRTIMAQVIDSLDRLDVPASLEYECIGLDFENSTLVRDPDGVTMHGTVTLTAYVRSAYPTILQDSTILLNSTFLR